MDDPESNRHFAGGHNDLPARLRSSWLHSQEAIGRLVYLHNAQ